MGKNRDFSKFPNAITVLDNGNVGINSAITPDWSYTGLKSSMSYNISLYGYTGTSGIAFNIYYNTGWKNVTNGGGAYIETDSNSNIVFYTSTTGILSGASTTTAERIRISGTGNVGIGTSSPAAKLHIYSSDTNMASDGATSYTYSKLRVEPYNGSSIGLSFGLISPNINYIQASYNNGTTASMSIQPFGGNVGIGTSSPSYALSISAGAGSGNNRVQLNPGTDYSFYQISNSAGTVYIGTDNSTGAVFGQGNYSMNIYNSYSGDINLFTAASLRMKITSSGSVTRPNQPSFLAYSTGFTATGGAWYNISGAMTTEEYDIQSNYSSGRFTAPVAGRYVFFFGGYSSIASNGDRYATCFTVNGGGYSYISGGNYSIADSPLNGMTVIYNLAANDYVELAAFSSVTGTWGHSVHRVFWGGYLL